MRGREYEIFSGSLHNEPVWLETVEGIAAATNRMKERARIIPGQYFVYSIEDSAVFVWIDTSDARCLERKNAA